MNRTDRKFLVDTLLFAALIVMGFLGLLMGFVLAEGPSAGGTSKYFLGLHRHQWGRIHFYASLAFIVLMIIHLVLNWTWIKGKTRLLFKKRARLALLLTAAAPIVVLGAAWLGFPKNDPAFEFYGRGGERLAEAGAFGRGVTVDRESPADKENPAGRHESRSGEPAGVENLGGGDFRAGRKGTGGGMESDIATRIRERDRETGMIHDDSIRLSDGRYLLITGRLNFAGIERETGIEAHLIAAKLGLPSGIDREESLGRLRRRYGFQITDVRQAVEELIQKR